MADVRRLFRELERLATQLATAVDRRLQRETDLPLSLFGPMSVIASRDACRICELAAGLNISSGGASKLADRLEVRGHCRRLPNPADRRSCLLKLTPAGTALLATAERVVDAELGDVLGSQLSVAEVAELIALLRGLRAAMRAGWANEERAGRSVTRGSARSCQAGAGS